jgi:hypothetical protein
MGEKESDIKIKIIGEEKINGIITRAEAKWQTEDKNSTHYLCNLEKIKRICVKFLSFGTKTKWPYNTGDLLKEVQFI